MRRKNFGTKIQFAMTMTCLNVTVEMLIKHVPNYDPFGETEINSFQREQIKADCLLSGSKSAAIVKESEKWMLDTFSKHAVFTILVL